MLIAPLSNQFPRAGVQKVARYMALRPRRHAFKRPSTACGHGAKTSLGRQRREASEPAEVLRYTTDGYEINRVPVYKGPWGRLSWQPRQEGSMDTTTLLIILIVVLILFGGGWYGRGRWF